MRKVFACFVGVMGKSVSRCGGRVREVVTCSRGLKKQSEGSCDGHTKVSPPPNKASKPPAEHPQDTKAVTNAQVVKATSPSEGATCGLVGSSCEDVVREVCGMSGEMVNWAGS